MKEDWSLIAWLKRKTTALGWWVASHRDPGGRAESREEEKEEAVQGVEVVERWDWREKLGERTNE